MSYSTVDPSPEVTRLLQAARWQILRPGICEKAVLHQGHRFKLVRIFCQDCLARSYSTFMVKDFIWRSVGLQGQICLDCFEKHLGRPVVRQDLKEGPQCNEFLLRKVPEMMPEDAWEAEVAVRLAQAGLKANPPSVVAVPGE
jgi:hypothetical protein